MFYECVASGKKKFELRVNDRNYAVGDMLLLREYAFEYTGKAILCKVLYCLDITDLIGTSKRWCIMAISVIWNYEKLEDSQYRDIMIHYKIN